jgi:hypothetical protein
VSDGVIVSDDALLQEMSSSVQASSFEQNGHVASGTRAMRDG